MSGPKPTLGFSTRTDAVLRLRALGFMTFEIAEKLGIPPKTVTALEHSAGRRSRHPRAPTELCRTVLFPIDVLAALGPHAAKRNMHPNQLARLIVETVVADKMIDAVLDDAESGARP